MGAVGYPLSLRQGQGRSLAVICALGIETEYIGELTSDFATVETTHPSSGACCEGDAYGSAWVAVEGDATLAAETTGAGLLTLNHGRHTRPSLRLASQAIFHGRKWAGRSEGKIRIFPSLRPAHFRP